MSQASIRSLKFGQAISAAPRFDKRIIVPILVVAYCLIISPFLIFLDSSVPAAGASINALTKMPETRYENTIFWPAVTAISVILMLRNGSRLARPALPPHIVWFAAYLAFAGTSAIWAFNPAVSFSRFCTQVMMVTSIVVPALLADRTADLMRGLFLAFAVGAVLNFIIVIDGPPRIVDGVFYYQGYFTDKNALGEYASIAVFLALHEMLYPGLRRALGVVVVTISALLLFLSNSKTSIGLVFLSPLLAASLVLIGKKMRISPAIALSPIVFLYILLYNTKIFNHISYVLYGNYTFSARTLMWDFVRYEIERRPLLGWGYQSFWQLGPNGPSVVDGWGWLKTMPHAHNGYFDTMLDMGYVGFVFLLIFIFATLHAAGRLIDRDPARAWLVLSLALYEIITNFLESNWLRGGVWVMFVILVAEIGRYWYPLSSRQSFAVAGRNVRKTLTSNR
jgi:O-antigen ligase